MRKENETKSTIRGVCDMVLSRAAQSKGGSAPPNAYISIGQSDPKKILILQGPVGPFFKELHNGFSDRGFRVRRVVFNPADCLFSNPNEYFRFSGSISDWEIWLSGELSQNTPDVIILFGSMRPAHQSARKLAEHLRIPVISLEEGYLRTGFVTCELGGNNQHSPLCQWHTIRKSDVPAPKALPLKSTFSAMSLWGAVYYLVRDVFSKPPDEALFHRKRESALSLSLSWMQHSVRRIIARVVEAPKLKRLRHNYLLVPLQVPSDSQVTHAARGWSSEKLVIASIEALSGTPLAQELVFKLHPLDRSGSNIRKLICEHAKKLDVSHRVYVFQTGKLGDITKRSSGMVVINSTSAFSALRHHIPILVMGNAIFRHDQIVTVGNTQKDLEIFFETPKVKSREKIAKFMNAVQREALVPGDFYHFKGRAVAVIGIIKKAERVINSHSSQMNIAI